MGHGGDWGGFVFWLFIGAIVIAGTWEKIRKNAEKHQTLRMIIEKTGQVDESRLKELFTSSGADEASAPGETYRGLRIGGTIVMSLGVAAAVFFSLLGYADVISRKAAVIGLSAACAGAILGLAIFFSSRFASPPPGQGNGPSAW